MNSFLSTLKKLGPARMAVMGGILFGLLIFFIFISLRISTPSMELLYSDLSTIDSSSIAAKLEEEQINYSVSADGSRVMVPANQIGRARMLLAEAGLPDGGSMGYEIFDEQSGFGTTNFVQNINQVRALEGELARTIASLEPIRNARVHIVLPQRELFSREETEARASVVLNVRPGERIQSPQSKAIQSLVASAIPELNINNISIVDQTGTLLASAESDPNALFNNRTIEMRRNVENRLRQNVEEIVGKIVGFGKVRATVNAELNLDRITTNEELYDPETQVVRSSQITEEQSVEREPQADEIGVENNLPGAGANLLADPQPTSESNQIEEVTNYEISRTVRNSVREVGEVRKLSVAVLVDGNYQTVTSEDGETTQEYVPRSEEEMDQIRNLVSSAVGIDQTRGDSIEVVNMQFADAFEDDLFEEDLILGFESEEITELATVLIVSIALVLIVLLVLRPMIGRILEVQEPLKEEDDLETDLLTAQAAAPALTGPGGEEQDLDEEEGERDDMIDMNQVEGKVKASSIKKVEDIVESYPEEAVSVIRSWMTQEG